MSAEKLHTRLSAATATGRRVYFACATTALILFSLLLGTKLGANVAKNVLGRIEPGVF